MDPSAEAVLLVGPDREWPPEFKAILRRDGYRAGHVADLSLVPVPPSDARVRAVFVSAGPLGASDLLVVRRLRTASPRMAIVVVTSKPTDPDLKRAFESGATAFLSWPASAEALRHAVESADGPGVVDPNANTAPGGRRP